jgi:hypothetical protein
MPDAPPKQQQQQQDMQIDVGSDAVSREQADLPATADLAADDSSDAAMHPGLRSSSRCVRAKNGSSTAEYAKKRNCKQKKSAGRSAGRRNAKVLESSDDSGTETGPSGAPRSTSSSDSGSDSEQDFQAQRQTSRERRQQQQQQQQQPDSAVNTRDTEETKTGGISSLSAAALAKQGQQLQQRQQQLEDALQDWQLAAARVNDAALERDLQALQSLAAAHAELQQLQQQQDEAVAVREQLLDERYARLLAVLQALNAALDGVYRQLTGGGGSAYCAYTQVRADANAA